MAQEQGSIRQNRSPPELPDLCNLGVTLRALAATNLLALLGMLLRDSTLAGFGDRFAALAMWVEPVLITAMLAICGARQWLVRLPYRASFALAVAAVALIARLYTGLVDRVLIAAYSPWQVAFWAALVAAAVLEWLALLRQAHSPALAEARLMALTARIRPHFLFNSLNAILGVIRSEPRRAEAALEELAELFRVLMQDPRELVPLSDEIALARRYIELERLRLGERLQVTWDVESCPPDALMPPLMMQPLLENAVYHGVEPAESPGMISIRLTRTDKEIQIELSNPLVPGHVHAKGNQMALANIRERLLLFFDIEAGLIADVGRDRYTVRIRMPYRKK